jgi:hypothetical protein
VQSAELSPIPLKLDTVSETMSLAPLTRTYLRQPPNVRSAPDAKRALDKTVALLHGTERERKPRDHSVRTLEPHEAAQDITAQLKSWGVIEAL